MSLKSLCKYVVIIASVFIIEACGFTFSNGNPIPLKTLYVEFLSNQSYSFLRNLQSSLKYYSPNTKLVNNSKESKACLKHIKEKRIIRKISSDNQDKVFEYELILMLAFELVDSNNRILIPETILSDSQFIFCEKNSMHNKKEQIEIVYQDMQRNIIDLLIHRLRALEIQHNTKNY
ncbi:MAG: hypothetical protein IR526_03615 [Bordetella sp.]|nr:MAG: hypothetical protein IR526_03615 [Bordetella sp.]